MRGQLRISVSTTRAASPITCSQLSTISKSCLFLSAEIKVSVAAAGASMLMLNASAMMEVTS